MADLEVSIGADGSELKRDIAELENELDKLRKQKSVNIKLGIENTELIQEINEAKAKLNELKGSLKAVQPAAQSFKKGVQDGGNTLTQFSRIAQDAPFGIIGIGNNLTATAESFGQLAKASGGAGNALKAIGASIMGPGGILLAISLVTTAFTYMAQSGLTVGDVIDKLTGKFDENAKMMQETRAEAAKSSASEIASLQAYVSIAQDENETRENRLIAVQKLQSEYPGYFGNLSKEKILNGDLTEVTKELTKAIVARAKASAISAKIGELAAKELLLREKLTKAALTYNNALKNINAEKDTFTMGGGLAGGVGMRSDISNLLTAKGAFTDITDELKKIVEQQNILEKGIIIETQASIGLDFKPDAKKKAKKEIERMLDISDMIIPQFGMDDLWRSDKNTKFYQGLKDEWGTKIPETLTQYNERIASQMASEMKLWLIPFAKLQTELFNVREVIGSAVADIGTSMGEALAAGTSVLEAAGASLLQSISALLSQIGSKLIEVGVAAVISSTVLASIFTPAGMAAGLAAIAVGTALKGVSGFMSGKAKGIGKTGGSKAMSTGADVTSPSYGGGSLTAGGMGSGTVVFEISGQSLIGVLSNTMDKNARLGGRLALP